ncbi:cadmium resistance transporter [Periweissella fabalis]|uniref:Cadmium resistance transporter n=1 Tax=Periweissella fabalis TaxID=1070421 RepID=A0A7X6N158_9LACO|nr:cadmium resistance transporter [Periweissella fabalis]MCM0599069.1 cadmium resistance transporter [Periweissella fabalis]NKZ23349.1 hypothetical protein [Periweissella fabalis]
MLQLVVVTIGIFISTNLDDLVILLLLNEEIIKHRLRVQELVYGQLIGMAILVLTSWLLSMGLSYVAPSLMQWLGIVPILMGLKMLITNLHAAKTTDPAVNIQTKPWRNVLAITALTLAGGADNLAIYIPVLQQQTLAQAMLMIGVFMPLTVGWIYLSVLIAQIPPIKWVLTKYTDKLVPIVFMLLGVLLLLKLK